MFTLVRVFQIKGFLRGHKLLEGRFSNSFPPGLIHVDV